MSRPVTPETVAAVLTGGGFECYKDDRLSQVIEDSLDVMEAILVLEDEWPTIEDMLRPGNSVWETGTVADLATYLRKITP